MTAAIRVAVIGAGVTANLIHLPILARLAKQGEISLAVICDLDVARAAAARRRYGFGAATGDAAVAVTRRDIDVVYIFGSAQMHYEYGLLALRAGKHLFVEKPVAPGYAEAVALVQAAGASNVVAVGGHNRRFYKSIDALRARAGRAGWRFAEAIAHKSEFGKPPPFGARSWLTANGIHALDALVFLMGGLPDTLASFTGGGDPPSTFSATMRWTDGALGAFTCDNDAGARREEYAVHAPGETCRIGQAGLVVEMGGRRRRLQPFDMRDGFAAEHGAFLDAIRTGVPPRHALAALVPSLFLAEQIERGFQGALILPTLVTPARAPQHNDAAVLVVGAGLQDALAQRLSGCRLVGIADVMDAPGSMPDVRAALIGRGAPPLSDAVLDKLPHLGVVGVVGLSVAHQRPDELLRRGIALFNASGAYAETVADFAFALAVLGRRCAFQSHAAMRAGGWGTDIPAGGTIGAVRRSGLAMRPLFRALGIKAAMQRLWRRAALVSVIAGGTRSRDLRGATVGLVGWGANARALAARLHRSGARVLAWSEHADARDMDRAAPASLTEVLSADIVSLHRGLTPATRHFLGAAELRKLRPGAVLINVARGGLVDPSALLARLTAGDIFACLDTFDEEPPAKDDPLRALPNVFLTSHIAGGSPEMHDAAAEEVVGRIADWLEGAGGAPIAIGRLATMT